MMSSPGRTPDQQFQDRRPRLARRGLYLLLLSAFVLGGAFIIASNVLIPSRSKVALEEGDVAPRDILAPRSLKYESAVLTQAKKDAAVAAVRPVYDPPDPSVASEQSQRARQILDFIENVRADDFATLDQKKSDLAAITDLSLSPAVMQAILTVGDDDTWQAIDAQITRLLERVMSGEVREDNIQAIRDNLHNLISASYSETEVQVITAIVSDLIRPNAFYNEELTHQAENLAAQSVPVEVRTFARGQMIIREGEIATAAHIEALQQFGLLQGTRRRTEQFAAGLLAMGLITAVLGAYTRQFYPRILADPGFVVLLGILFLVFLGGVRLVDSGHATRPYYYPASALAFLVATLVGPQFAIIVIAALAALAGVMAGNSLELAVLIVLSGTLGVLSLGRTERLNGYFVAGGVVGLTSAGVAVLFALGADQTPDVVTVLSKILGSLANGFFSAAVALMGLYIITGVLNIPTSLKLIELQQPNHPLLQRLLREAPGTYQHSLQVANLAELAAQRVDANAALLRVAAMYHDVGKILNPHFFVENQADGINPHDGLNNPYQSARIIIGHVTEGERLARRYRLPHRIRDFVLEHHGTTQVVYFHRQALERAANTDQSVNVEDFTYPGPRPQTRETAILMLADGCESSVRARRPQSRDDIRETVDYIFETRLQSGQLDDSGLTLNDLRLLRDTFLTALQGVFHPRIAYPGTPGQGTPALPKESVSQLPAGKSKPDTPQVSSDPPVEKPVQDEPVEDEPIQNEAVPESVAAAPETADVSVNRLHPPGLPPDTPGAKDGE
jgi:putative nucleotidyltransferase with HDIG domain